MEMDGRQLQNHCERLLAIHDYLFNLAMLEKGILEHLLESSLESRPAEDLEDL